MRVRPPPAAIVVTCAVAATALAGAALAPASLLAQDDGDLRGRAERARERERTLAGDVARLGRVVARLDGDVAVIERRRAEVQSELAVDRRRLSRIREALRAQRRRVVRLRARLRRARTVLAARLVELYRTAPPDLITVVMRARGFADLLEQAEYAQAIGEQDARIIRLVQHARRDAAGAVATLARDERRQEDVTAAIAARREALVAMGAALARRRAAVASARVVRSAALATTRAGRIRLEHRIAALEAQRAQEARAQGPGGPWAIPSAIVQCESGGQNLPPNSAGASGYYQILPSTWELYGGSGGHAHRASKAEQDRVAARIWDGGRGASQWVCAGLVSGG
jgi:septal ring factor EnvC (AmiA/AmiB activator)